MKDVTFPKVILVNQNNQEIGVADKMNAHRQGLLHRAFSVFIFRETSIGLEFLLQQRHHEKYHSGGLWTNSCCSHPQPGIPLLTCVANSLNHEIGITPPVHEIGTFIYKATFANGMTENELDHVFVAKISLDSAVLKPHPNEVSALKWLTLDEIDLLLKENPDQFTAWFAPAYALVKKWTATLPDSL